MYIVITVASNLNAHVSGRLMNAVHHESNIVVVTVYDVVGIKLSRQGV